jgi:hypothetical protein
MSAWPTITSTLYAECYIDQFFQLQYYFLIHLPSKIHSIIQSFSLKLWYYGKMVLNCELGGTEEEACHV